MAQLHSLTMVRSSLQTIVTGALLGLCAILSVPTADSQAITLNTASMGPVIDRRYAQIESTKVALPAMPIDARGHQEILRSLSAEQGFAMRPFPRGKRGLKLEANGKLSPSGQGYLTAISEQGLSVKPGDRVVLSNIRIDKDRLIFDINGGPEHRHQFLRHIQIGMGDPSMAQPVVQDDTQEPTGSRITLAFDKFVPDVTPAQVKTLLAPLISFDVKTPVQAYTDTLPSKLKEAILGHHVLVGMNTDMVLFTMGQPDSKSREIDGQTPFEEWIYGHPPQDISFVRVNGNRVIRVEVAKLGQPLEIFTKDEVEGLMMTDGRPALASTTVERRVELGDVQRDPNTQSAAAPPTLRAPGEKLPTDSPAQQDPHANREGPMQPVIFPKDTSKEPAQTVPAHSKPAAPVEDEDNDGTPATAKAAKPPGARPGSVRPPYGKPDSQQQATPAGNSTASPETGPDVTNPAQNDSPPSTAPKTLMPAARF